MYVAHLILYRGVVQHLSRASANLYETRQPTKWPSSAAEAGEALALAEHSDTELSDRVTAFAQACSIEAVEQR